MGFTNFALGTQAWHYLVTYVTTKDATDSYIHFYGWPEEKSASQQIGAIRTITDDYNHHAWVGSGDWFVIHSLKIYNYPRTDHDLFNSVAKGATECA